MALLQVRDLTVRIDSEGAPLTAVDGVDLEIGEGEAVALVGESGCGKSLTALSIMGLTRAPVHTGEGAILFDGQDLRRLDERALRSLRGARMSMVFQDPMTFLNPLMRVGEQIAEVVRLHQGLDRGNARKAALAALEQVRIPAPVRILDAYPHQLSGGMRQRVLIAIAIACKPRLLIADEPTTALDVTIQAQIMDLLAEVRRDLGSALLLITHDLGLVAEYCDRVYVMYAGRIVERGDIFELFAAPKHPYTRALLESTLSIDRRAETFEAIGGQPPHPARLPRGCAFQPRCSAALARCSTKRPPGFTAAPGREVRCWLHEPGHVQSAR